MQFLGLIYAIERCFGIDFPLDPSLELRTVGELYQWLLSQQPRHVDPAAAARVDEIALERLRPVLASIIDRPAAALDESTDLRALIPFFDRRCVWQQLRHDLGLQIPQLIIPRWLLHRLVAASIGVGLCLFPSIGHHGLVLATSMLVTGFVCLVPLAVTIPPQNATLQGLATEIARKNFARLTTTGEPYTAQQLWATVIDLISKELDIPADEILPSSRWVEDLRCD